MSNTLKTIYTCFPKGRIKVLTMSYDDGTTSDKRLIELFNDYKIKGTFHLNGGLSGKSNSRIALEDIKDLYKGHEVSAHTYTHPTIARCPMPLVIEQILKDRSSLERACGYPVRGLSYPNRSVSKDILSILPHCGIEYARTGNSTHSFGMPDNFYLWDPTCHHSENLLQLGKEFVDLYKPWYLYMMYVWGHSYEFDDNNDWGLMEDFCRMSGGHDDIWYATNIEIVDYMNAAKSLKFTADMDKVYNPSATTVWIAVDEQVFSIESGETVNI